jgi:hypothetical protein
MSKLKEVNGYYGSENTPCIVFIYGAWYVVEGSINVNKASDEDLLINDVDVETLQDVDYYTSTDPINSLEELQSFIDDE